MDTTNGFQKNNYFFFKVSNITGVATNTDEYVPIRTPIINANINPLIDSPPKINIETSTTNVVNDVLRVLLRVLFNAPSTILGNSQEVLMFLYSLILSKTTTVSFKE